MDTVLKHLVIMYEIKEYDWLNFKITKDNPLTFHHIKKEQHGGEKTFKNGAPLTDLGHSYLHQIEVKDKRIFYELSKQLQRINDSKTKITDKDKKIIERLLLEYETKHDTELRRKIKTLRYNPKALRSIKGSRDIFSPTNIRMVMQLGINPLEQKKKTKKNKKRYWFFNTFLV